MAPKSLIAGALLLALGVPASAQTAPDIELWRLDCGTLQLSDSGSFSDTHLYDGRPRDLTDSCYLIRNGDKHLLWDTGLPGDLVGKTLTTGVYTVSVERSLADQLADLGLTPADIDYVGVSHYHFDHIGQLADFAGATLLIGADDMAAVKAAAPSSGIDPKPFAPWLDAGKSEMVAGDKDVFGDGTVTMIDTPGHTPGHHALLVRLPESGNLLLTGDLYHFEEQIVNRGVPQFNTDRADTLASMDRFDRMADTLDATIIIQHDPRHLVRLPAFPESAK